MTKTQITKQLETIRDMLQDLYYEVEETVDSIEPYENRNDLTPQQEERQEWLENVRDSIETAISDLEENI